MKCWFFQQNSKFKFIDAFELVDDYLMASIFFILQLSLFCTTVWNIIIVYDFLSSPNFSFATLIIWAKRLFVNAQYIRYLSFSYLCRFSVTRLLSLPQTNQQLNCCVSQNFLVYYRSFSQYSGKRIYAPIVHNTTLSPVSHLYLSIWLLAPVIKRSLCT